MQTLRKLGVAAIAITLGLVVLLFVGGDIEGGKEFELAVSAVKDAAATEQLDARDATKLCKKKKFILDKIGTLLARLRKERVFLNVTDVAAFQEFDEAFELWLDTESVYRLSTEQWHQSESAAKYTLYQLKVAKRVAKLMSKNVEDVVKEYPVKKESINDERNMILQLIELVKSLDANNLDSSVGSKELETIDRQVLSLKRDFKQTAAVKKLATVATTLKSAGLKRLSKEEVGAVKKAILEVLMQLLKDPDFRAFVLKTGMENIVKELKQDETDVTKLERKAIDLSQKADKAKAKSFANELIRKKKEGDKITKEEDYKDEHQQWLEKYPSVDKSIYILDQVRKKICTYCKTGKWVLGFAEALECCEEYSRRSDCKATPTCKWTTQQGCQYEAGALEKFQGK